VRAILISALIFAGAASAAPDIPPAPVHYERGRQLYLEGKFEQALHEFTIGFELVPRPEFLINMGLCNERLGRYREARDLFAKFLAAAPESHRLRPDVEELLRKAEAELAAHPEPVEKKPAPIVEKPAPPAAVVVAAPPPPPPKKKRPYWIIPVVGVVVAGVAVGLGVGLTRKSGCDGKGLCVDASQ
jgi:tetratricopeptide (TPR) repeat protein